MERFYQTICNGVVGCCPNSFHSKQLYQLLPKMGLKLSSSISCDDGENTKSHNPAGDKCVSNCLSHDICYQNCFWPACEMVLTCQQVCETISNGNGPTISRWIWSNRASSVAKVENGVTVCRCNFKLWHCRHVRAHLLTSEFMLGHTNCAVTRCYVARIPGCESEWSESNTARLKLGGT